VDEFTKFDKAPEDFDRDDPEYGKGEMTNRRRAGFAAAGVRAFAEEVHMIGTDGQLVEDVDTIVGDFLADLRHFCAGHGIDFDRVNEAGVLHYEYESNPNRFDSLEGEG